jgi:hypothetical protein
MDSIYPTRFGTVRDLSALYHRIRDYMARVGAYRYLAINELTIPLYVLAALLASALYPMLIFPIVLVLLLWLIKR